MIEDGGLKERITERLVSNINLVNRKSKIANSQKW